MLLLVVVLFEYSTYSYRVVLNSIFSIKNPIIPEAPIF